MKEFEYSEAEANKAETAILVGLVTPQQDEAKTKEYLDELEFLADTAGAVTVKRFTQKAGGPSQTSYVGKGKLEEIRQYIKDEEDNDREIGMVIFDDELSAKQLRNIENRTSREDSRPHIAHPRHLCHACTDRQCQDTGGVGTIPLYVASLAAHVDAPGTSGRWLRIRRWQRLCGTARTG